MSKTSFTKPKISIEKLLPGQPSLAGALHDVKIKNNTNKTV